MQRDRAFHPSNFLHLPIRRMEGKCHDVAYVRGGVGRGLGRIEIALEIDLVASAENIGDDALA